ncbi:MAG: hypothetical protein IJF07_06395, partial [Lachnospiraceae bacterium]|nr:hypothetical protein [Lachnospiraceae bacterium]
PYANYMIASQETEPGWGWSYEFLSQLSDEVLTGAEMGKSIIDYYMLFGNLVFAQYPRMYSDLTLSCIDLNQYQAAEEALNTCFAELDSTLDVDTYRDIVRNRENTRAFGSYSTNFDYGMVDAIHLIEQLAPESTSASAAIEAIDNMIVYSQSNMSNACGISICYPYETNETYTQNCIAIQENMNFAEDYTGFLRDFHAIESGASLFSGWDFSKAATMVNTLATEGTEIAATSDITLQLTAQQQANYASAGYYILCNAKQAGYSAAEKDSRADDMYFFIHAGQDIKLDTNGMLHAYYGNSALYVYDKTLDSYSPIPMILIEKDSTDTEKRYTCFATMNNWNIAPDITNWETTSGQLQVVISEEYPNGIIRNVIPLADSSEIQSASKQLINLDDYGILEISASCRYFTRDENGQMMNFYSWEDSGWIMGFDQDLTHEYSLELQPLENPENYYCMFYIKDTQGNTSYSELIPLK